MQPNEELIYFDLSDEIPTKKLNGEASAVTDLESIFEPMEE